MWACSDRFLKILLVKTKIKWCRVNCYFPQLTPKCWTVLERTIRALSRQWWLQTDKIKPHVLWWIIYQQQLSSHYGPDNLLQLPWQRWRSQHGCKNVGHSESWYGDSVGKTVCCNRGGGWPNISHTHTQVCTAILIRTLQWLPHTVDSLTPIHNQFKANLNITSVPTSPLTPTRTSRSPWGWLILIRVSVGPQKAPSRKQTRRHWSRLSSSTTNG